MSLVKTSLLNGVVVAVRIGTALVLNKVFAVILGPSGYAAIGQFQNAVTVALSISSAGISTGVTKGTAANAVDVTSQHGIWRTAFRIAIVLSGLTGLAICFSSSFLSSWLLKDPELRLVFVFLGVFLPAVVANNLLLAIVNGKKDVGLYVKANILASVLVLVIASFLTIWFGVKGALIAFAVSPAFGLVATLFLLRRRDWFAFSALRGRIDPNARRELMRFGLMGIVGAIAMPVAYILIRQRITEVLGVEAAGYWQAVWRISEVYLMLITTTLSLYFLPRLGEIKSGRELRTEISRIYKLIIPVVLLSAILIFSLREFIIEVLFTADFGPMRDLFFWQLVGDALKIGSWVFGYVLLGRAMVKSYIFAELFFSSLFFALVAWLILVHGIQGVPIAYAITYVLYWIFVSAVAYWEMRRMPLNDDSSFSLEKL